MHLSDLIGDFLGAIVFAVVSCFLLLVVASAMHASGLIFLTYVTLSMGALSVIGSIAFCVDSAMDCIRYKKSA